MGQEPFIPYNAIDIDRGTHLREDSEWLGRALGDGANVIPYWRDQCLIVDGEPLVVRRHVADVIASAAGAMSFLGLDGETPVFAADLSAHEESRVLEITEADGTADLRRLVGTLAPARASLLAYGRGLLHWQRHHEYCGTCGTRTDGALGGHVRKCPAQNCGREIFPRIEPAVIVFIEAPEAPDRCLLVRAPGTDQNAYSAVAGFVEIGESLEDAVRREVAEETGLAVSAVTYQASQAWPFPASLMVGFRARAATEAFSVDGVEIEEARWFTREEVRELDRQRVDARSVFPTDSIEWFLLGTWLAEAG